MFHYTVKYVLEVYVDVTVEQLGSDGASMVADKALGAAIHVLSSEPDVASVDIKFLEQETYAVRS